MAFSISKLTANVNNIQDLSDKPNETDGLTAQALKEKFDKAGSDIKTYINGTLTVEVENEVNSINSSLEDFVLDSDARLTNSRKCNNTFDNNLTARQNLGIKYGTSLPSTGNNGDLFFLYE